MEALEVAFSVVSAQSLDDVSDIGKEFILELSGEFSMRDLVPASE